MQSIQFVYAAMNPKKQVNIAMLTHMVIDSDFRDAGLKKKSPRLEKKLKYGPFAPLNNCGGCLAP
jgi:hypothetical protein